MSSRSYTSMKACLFPHLRLVVISAVLCAFLAAPLTSRAADANAGDREQCAKNLTNIFKAIQMYRAERKDVPNWLSDLVPKYIKDPNTLICPVIKRTGEVKTLGVEDPKISTAYL